MADVKEVLSCPVCGAVGRKTNQFKWRMYMHCTKCQNAWISMDLSYHKGGEKRAVCAG